MSEDVRDKSYLNHKDVIDLNFIRDHAIYLYRRHYRTGLRSHIMEVLSPGSVKKEKEGIVVHGMRQYPRAEPLKMLRIFRKRFKTLKGALEEVRRVKIIQSYLAPDHLARSEEFLVSYARRGRCDLLLCGFQEYIKGEIFEPWSPLDKYHLVSLLSRMETKKGEDSVAITDQWLERVRENAAGFIGKLKQMIVETRYVPDLAGVGNLIITLSGDIKLVDINNISKVSLDPIIALDDRDYPVCDKSVEALSLLEQKVLCRPIQADDPIYKTFLDPARMREVKVAAERFYLTMEPAMSYPRSFLP